jgi:hypothetical protein
MVLRACLGYWRKISKSDGEGCAIQAVISDCGS